MYVHWYFTKHFSELSYHFLSQSRILDELSVSFKHIEHLVLVFIVDFEQVNAVCDVCSNKLRS